MAQVSQHFTFLAFSLRLLGLAYLVIIVSAHLFPSFNIQKIANLASQNILSACSSVLKGAWDKFMLKRDLAKEPSGFRRLQAWRLVVSINTYLASSYRSLTALRVESFIRKIPHAVMPDLYTCAIIKKR